MRLRGQFRLFRFAGIQVYLHWSWFLVALIEIQARVGAYSTPAWNVLEYLSLFAIVTIHEFGHALACRSVGGTPDRILLWPFGGVAYVNPPQRPGATLWSVAAGPLVNVALAPTLWAIAHALAAPNGTDPALFLRNVQFINLGLLIFNILPIYPLDGGQILRSLLWFVMGRAQSLMAAAVLGLAGVAALAYLAIRTSDLWLLAISAYIGWSGWNGLQNARALWRIARAPRHSGFACPLCRSTPPLGPYWRCPRCAEAIDILATAGQCPACGAQFSLVPCFDCGRVSPPFAWADASVTPVGRFST